MIGYGIAISVIAFITIILLIVFSDDREWFPPVIAILIFAIFILTTQMERSNSYWHTKLIHRYQQGDYSLEIIVERDKVDTLYIFK